MKNENEAKHSPTPWRVDDNRQGQRRLILEAGNHVLGACWGNYWDFPDVNTDESDKRAEADAAFIVEAVNAHERLVAALQRCERWFAGVTSLFDREHVGAEMRVPAMSAFYELDKIRAALGEEAANG